MARTLALRHSIGPHEGPSAALRNLTDETKNFIIEVGVNTRNIYADEDLAGSTRDPAKRNLNSIRGGFLLSFEPILDKY